MSSRALKWAGAVVAAAAMAAGGTSYALASARQATPGAPMATAASSTSYSLSFSPNKPKSSTSLTVTLASTQQPQSATITLPAGVVLNLRAAAVCSAPPACDPSTQVGSGTAQVHYQGYIIPVHFIMYNHLGGLSVVISNPNSGPQVTSSPTWSGTTLTVPYPNGTYKGEPIQVASLTMIFDQLGSGGGAFMRTPAACSKAGWPSTATLTYASGAPANLSAAAKCQVPTKKKKHKKHKKRK